MWPTRTQSHLPQGDVRGAKDLTLSLLIFGIFLIDDQCDQIKIANSL